MRRSGFTIVELLVVIVVISILASITVVAFSGIRESARDTVRKTDLRNIANVMNIYATEVDPNMMGMDSGCGASGHGSGWWHTTEPQYPKSTRQCLVDAGYTQVGSILDPSECAGGSAPECASKPRYMVLHCQKNTTPVVYLLAQLETEPQDATFTDAICDAGTSTGFASVVNWDTAYRINYLVQIK